MMNETNNFVRIVVLNYNQPEYTISTVNDLLLQEIENKEIIVVDNCSTSANYELLEYGLSNKAILIRSNVNLGYARGNNLGCKYKSKNKIDYYFILNNDVIIDDRNLINKLIKSIDSNTINNVVAVSPLIDTVSTELPLESQIQIRRILKFDEQLIVNSPFLNKIFKKTFQKYIYKDKMPFLNKYTISDSINGAAFMIKADVFKKNGFLDDGTFLFFEEIILGKQLKMKGYKCVLDGFSTLKHLQGLSTKSYSKSYNLKMEKEKIISEMYYFEKILKKPVFLIYLIRQLRYFEILLLYYIKN